VEFQNGIRVAPFVVLRSDFLAVLESDRGSPRQTASAGTNAPGNLCPDVSAN
jgi:hypothetical protein